VGSIPNIARTAPPWVRRSLMSVGVIAAGLAIGGRLLSRTVEGCLRSSGANRQSG
jgi:hypothetical protein